MPLASRFDVSAFSDPFGPWPTVSSYELPPSLDNNVISNDATAYDGDDDEPLLSFKREDTPHPDYGITNDYGVVGEGRPSARFDNDSHLLRSPPRRVRELVDDSLDPAGGNDTLKKGNWLSTRSPRSKARASVYARKEEDKIR